MDDFAEFYRTTKDRVYLSGSSVKPLRIDVHTPSGVVSIPVG